VNIFKTILKLTQVSTKKAVTAITLITSSIAVSIATPAYAGPQGDFGIVTSNGNRVDVYGDYLPTYKGPMHLWKAIYSSNIFTLGPNEGTGNEIRLKADPTICITPDVPLGVKPSSGTPLVAKRDCANSYNFKFEGGKIYMGRYPDICIDIPNNNDVVRQTLQVHSCNGSAAQQFNTGGQSTQNQKTITQEWSDYEYWMVVDAEYRLQGRQVPYIGHAWNAVIKKTTQKFSDGSYYEGPWNVIKTYSYNPSVNLTIDGMYEKKYTQAYLNGNQLGRMAVRKSRISETRANWIINQPNAGGCSYYSYPGTGNSCSCISYATRNWMVFSAGWEDFRPWGLFGRTPEELYNYLNDFNSKGQFLDQGKVWQ
jgi:hypothetical protein